MARQCFVSPVIAQNCRPKAFYSSKTHDNHAEKQYKAAQHRCTKVKASWKVVDALLRAWLCGPVSMCMVYIAVCHSMVEGDRRQQAFEARRQQLLQAHLSSSKQYPYCPRAQVSASKGDRSFNSSLSVVLHQAIAQTCRAGSCEHAAAASQPLCRPTAHSC
jgi:hypothetical protein